MGPEACETLRLLRLVSGPHLWPLTWNPGERADPSAGRARKATWPAACSCLACCFGQGGRLWLRLEAGRGAGPRVSPRPLTPGLTGNSPHGAAQYRNLSTIVNARAGGHPLDFGAMLKSGDMPVLAIRRGHLLPLRCAGMVACPAHLLCRGGRRPGWRHGADLGATVVAPWCWCQAAL